MSTESLSGSWGSERQDMQSPVMLILRKILRYTADSTFHKIQGAYFHTARKGGSKQPAAQARQLKTGQTFSLFSFFFSSLLHIRNRVKSAVRPFVFYQFSKHQYRLHTKVRWHTPTVNTETETHCACSRWAHLDALVRAGRREVSAQASRRSVEACVCVCCLVLCCACLVRVSCLVWVCLVNDDCECMSLALFGWLWYCSPHFIKSSLLPFPSRLHNDLRIPRITPYDDKIALTSVKDTQSLGRVHCRYRVLSYFVQYPRYSTSAPASCLLLLSTCPDSSKVLQGPLIPVAWLLSVFSCIPSFLLLTQYFSLSFSCSRLSFLYTPPSQLAHKGPLPYPYPCQVVTLYSISQYCNTL